LLRDFALHQQVIGSRWQVAGILGAPPTEAKLKSSGAIASLLICVDGLLLAIIVRLSQTALVDFNGSSYLPAYTMTSPELRYTINFTTRGVYTVWLRGYAPNAAGDSVYVSVDDQPSANLTGFAPRQWEWLAGEAKIEVGQPGLVALHIRQREDGLRLDRILLTTDNTYVPVGHGPGESEIR
jgi:hypothetical protein